MMKRFYFDETSSTMEEARRVWERDKTPVVVVARTQTEGRGRRGREWKSPSGGFYGTFIFKGLKDKTHYLGLSLAVGVGIVESLSLPDRVHLKWPNDLLVDEDLKLGGILIELLDGGGASVGIGINVSPVGIEGFKSSSLNEIGIRLSLDEVEKKVTAGLMDVFNEFEENGFISFKPRWVSRSRYLGKFITLDDGVSGEVKDISSDGALILDGGRRVISGTIL